MIIQNAKDNNVIITDHELNLTLLYACKIDNIVSEKIVKLIIDYAKETNTILTVDHSSSKCNPYLQSEEIILRWFNFSLIMPKFVLLY